MATDESTGRLLNRKFSLVIHGGGFQESAVFGKCQNRVFSARMKNLKNVCRRKSRPLVVCLAISKILQKSKSMKLASLIERWKPLGSIRTD